MNGIEDRNATAETPFTAGAPAGAAHAAVPPGVGIPPYTRPAAVDARDPRHKSAGLASFLSIVPGLGQVYVGYYQRGFIHAVVVSVIIALMASFDESVLIPLLPLFLVFFWLYNIIDAGRRATLYNLALAGGSDIEMPSDLRFGVRGSIGGGLLLIAGGFVLLLNTRFGVSLDWIEEWWPVFPMLLGAYLLAKAVQERTGPAK
jgi:TM2 domain-containing membrane protein YozV